MLSRLFKWSWRVYLVWILMAIALCTIVSRLIFLQLTQNEKGRLFLQRQGDMRVLHAETIPVSRGKIVDRNGKLLAYSTPVKSVWANPSLFYSSYTSGRTEALEKLAQVLTMTTDQLEKRLATNDHYVFLRRQLDPERADEIMSLQLKGIFAATEYKRYYPAAEITSQLLGFTGVDDRGQEGLELAYDERLKGTDGRRRVMRNRLGETIKDIRLLDAPKLGDEIQLSIDMNLQYIAYRELKRAVEKHGARSGSVVILDVATGEVLALVNQPSYNVNDRTQLRAELTRNRALIDVFEPGSTVKPFTIAAALEKKLVRPNTKIDTSPGYIRVDGKTIVDPKNYGVLNIGEILAKSSQVGTTKLALQASADDLRDMFSRVGFGEYCATGFPGEQVGFLPSHRRWQPIQRAALSFGHGMTVNSMQIARAYAVLAADGVKRPVSLLKQASSSTGAKTDSFAQRSQSGSASNTKAKVAAGEVVMDVALAKAIRQMMVDVVDRGTGSAAKISGYSVAGKTGTTHKVGRAGYEENRYRATFAGMVPADSPRLVSVVTIDDPRGEAYFGGEIAAPVFANVMSSAVRLLGISPDRIDELDNADVAEQKVVKYRESSSESVRSEVDKNLSVPTDAEQLKDAA